MMRRQSDAGIPLIQDVLANFVIERAFADTGRAQGTRDYDAQDRTAATDSGRPTRSSDTSFHAVRRAS